MVRMGDYEIAGQKLIVAARKGGGYVVSTGLVDFEFGMDGSLLEAPAAPAEVDQDLVDTVDTVEEDKPKRRRFR